MKEIVAKDSLLTLDENVRKCQENPQDLCTNKKFFDALKSKCQCIPFTLRFLAKQVCIQIKIGLISIHECYIEGYLGQILSFWLKSILYCKVYGWQSHSGAVLLL